MPESKRTLHFEVGFTLVDGTMTYWLQARRSDGEIIPCGKACRSMEELADFLDDVLDGEDYGAMANPVPMPSLPRDPGIRQ